jgi:hypothetical protein
LLFALDQSGSLREVIAQQREAALALFSRFGERSSVAVLRFSTRSMSKFSSMAIACGSAESP